MQEIFKKLHFIIILVCFLSFCYNIDMINIVYELKKSVYFLCIFRYYLYLCS